MLGDRRPRPRRRCLNARRLTWGLAVTARPVSPRARRHIAMPGKISEEERDLVLALAARRSTTPAELVRQLVLGEAGDELGAVPAVRRAAPRQSRPRQAHPA
jgi:hypothetical protein